MITVKGELVRLEPAPGQPTSNSTAWHVYATALHREAVAAFERHEDETAWELATVANRSLVPLMPLMERRTRALAARVEAEAKVTGWRKEAIGRLLGNDDDTDLDQAFLMEAILHLDTEAGNEFRKQSLRRHEFRLVAFLLVVALALVLVVSVGWSGAGLGSGKLVALALLFGTLGGCFSAIERTTGRALARVPNERVAGTVTSVQLLAGAAAGLVALAAAQAGSDGAKPGTILVAAFAAGFSERFVKQFGAGRGDGEELDTKGADPEPPTPRPDPGR